MTTPIENSDSVGFYFSITCFIAALIVFFFTIKDIFTDRKK